MQIIYFIYMCKNTLNVQGKIKQIIFHINRTIISQHFIEKYMRNT